MLLSYGQRLGKYTIKEQLGEPGGFGVVFRAEEDITGRNVAVKEFFVGGEETETELRMLSRLSHPFIIQYFTYENLNNTIFLVMEYASGGNLADLLKRQGPLSEGDSLKVLLNVADALAFAHSRDVVHRDIKPQNILCCDKEIFKLGDFGIARLLEKTHSRTQGRGSVYYVAPEIFKGEFNKKTDVYALGITFYEMLSGSPPYTGTEHEVMFKHLDENSRPVLPEGLSPLARRILEGCLEKDVAKRWDVEQLITALKSLMVHEQLRNGPDVHQNEQSAAAQTTVGRVDLAGLSGSKQPDNKSLKSLNLVSDPQSHSTASRKDFSAKLRWILIIFYAFVNMFRAVSNIFSFGSLVSYNLYYFLFVCSIVSLTIFVILHSKERYDKKRIVVFLIIILFEAIFILLIEDSFDPLAISRTISDMHTSSFYMNNKAYFLLEFFLFGYLTEVLVRIITGNYNGTLQEKGIFVTPLLASLFLVSWCMISDVHFDIHSYSPIDLIGTIFIFLISFQLLIIFVFSNYLKPTKSIVKKSYWIEVTLAILIYNIGPLIFWISIALHYFNLL